MSLHDAMIKSGHTLFRYRSYLPLLIIGPLIVALKEGVRIENLVGDDIEDIWVLFCFILSLCGLALRGFTVGTVPAGTSGRNANTQRADHLNVTGMYSVVRNPLYLGNFIIILGVLLSIKVWWLVLLGGLAFFIYMERIVLAEEKFLTEKYGQTYLDWRAKTPVIIPDFKLWEKAALPFSLRTVLRREYPGLLNIGLAFYITEMFADVLFEHEPFGEWLVEDKAWSITMGVIIVICMTLRFLKKKTNLLKVEGR
ncbi:MAG: lipid A phosphate methyltransferase [Micavibrio aeruginosavorus]|uniref:Lipid A phosphate methyltransferase n=1 Tax=Micavibrio aeruginosavorus TaxID=349221 RepID=A0A2W4ZMK8_9BACT|nr:MAG: lipid A phosphate methyltransferase [Micavibrio aeruginosavorus]